jgi:hypothetical protein
MTIFLSSCQKSLSLQEKYEKTRELYINRGGLLVSKQVILPALENMNLDELKGKCILKFATYGKWRKDGSTESLLISYFSDNIAPDSVIIKCSRDTNIDYDIIMKIPEDDLGIMGQIKLTKDGKPASIKICTYNLPSKAEILKITIVDEIILRVDRKILNLRQGDKVAMMSIKNGGIILSNWMELSEVECLKLPEEQRRKKGKNIYGDPLFPPLSNDNK